MSMCIAVPAQLLAIALVVQGADMGAWVTVREGDRNNGPAEVSPVSISRDGRYIAFASFARLVDADTDRNSDIYVLDRTTGAVTIECLNAGRYASRTNPRISGDGRFVVFETLAPPESPGSMAGRTIVLRDRDARTIQTLSGGSAAPSRGPAISADGHIVVFASSATDLVDGADLNGLGEDVYAYDIRTHARARISLDAAGRQPTRGESFAPAPNADGRFVAFVSTAPLATPAPGRSDARPSANVYLRDTTGGTTVRVSAGRGGAPPDGPSYDPAISGNGRRVVFVSDATNLVDGDRNRVADIFLFDADTGTIALISRAMGGGAANGPSGRPAISEDGKTIVFQSEASNLACCAKCSSTTRDVNLVTDVFLFNRPAGEIRCLSCGRRTWMEASAAPATNATGSVLAFSSRHPVDTDDMDNDFDLFVRVLDAPALTKR
jgi:Tol biopolymer transport system component